jgi:polyferredoxin
MQYSLEQIEKAIQTTRQRFFRSALMSSAVGVAFLFILSKSYKEELSVSSFLFFGFIIGFFTAGIILPKAFKAYLMKSF